MGFLVRLAVGIGLERVGLRERTELTFAGAGRLRVVDQDEVTGRVEPVVQQGRAGDDRIQTARRLRRGRRAGLVIAARRRDEAHTNQKQELRSSSQLGHMMMVSLVSTKSAIKIAIEITTTERVVLLPTPAVPPRVISPK